MKWHQALGDFGTAQRSANRSPGTIRTYRHYLEQLAEHVPRGPTAVRRIHLEQLLGRPAYGPEARKSARSAVCSFFRWAHGHGLVDQDPSIGLPPVRVPVKAPRPAPEHLVRRLLDGQDHRLVFMVMLAAFCGLRCAEIAQVHEYDVLEQARLVVHGKGGRERVVPVVHPALMELLTGVNGWAFPNGRGSHLTPGHVSRLLSAAMPEGWSGHKLRTRFGTVGWAGTRDLLATSRALGHSQVEVTMRYVLMPDEALRAVFAAAAAS